MTRKLAAMTLLVLLALSQAGCVVIGALVVKQIRANNRARAAALGTDVEKTVTSVEVVKESEAIKPVEAPQTRSKHEPEAQGQGKITRVNNAF